MSRDYTQVAPKCTADLFLAKKSDLELPKATSKIHKTSEWVKLPLLPSHVKASKVQSTLEIGSCEITPSYHGQSATTDHFSGGVSASNTGSTSCIDTPNYSGSFPGSHQQSIKVGATWPVSGSSSNRIVTWNRSQLPKASLTLKDLVNVPT